MISRLQRWTVPCVCLGLTAMIFAVFGQTAGFGFVNFDDDTYVYENPVVLKGLTLRGLAWVFTHGYFNLYHPLTMLSLMADFQIHGFHAGGFHLTNVLLHTASVVLLFLILRQMTGALWRSAFVAAVFAIHPLRVESVAWVSERKDVLCTFFSMLTFGAYLLYVRNPKSVARYLMVAVAFLLALLSKPMAVTLPLVLLLLDFWPLRRFEHADLVRETKCFGIPRRLLLEKIPLLALDAVVWTLNYLAAEKMFTNFGGIPLLSRIGNALVSYIVYLRQMIWPKGLAALYPIPQQGLSITAIAMAALALAAISALAWRERQRKPWLLVGWLWYCGMLTPVIGIVQVGGFIHADRFTYMPQIGTYLAVTWSVAEWWCHRPARVALGVLMASVLAVLMVCAWNQAMYWKDSETLWTHALACTTNNYVAHNRLGNALLQKGSVDDAINQYQLALQIKTKPEYPAAHYNLGNALMLKGKVDEAIDQYQDALQIEPDDPSLHYVFAVALQQRGRMGEAITQYEKTLQIEPDNADAHYYLANVLQNDGRVDEAIVHYENALQLKPAFAEAHFDFARALVHEGNMSEAIVQYEAALQAKPDYAQAYNNLGSTLLQMGRPDEAIAQYENALQIRPDYVVAHENLGSALLQKGKLDEAITHLQTALQIKPDARAHFILANALCQKDDPAEAIAHYQQALRIEPGAANVQNSLAYLLSTCPQASLRNGTNAVHLAEEAVTATHRKDAGFLDTLAAAYAETHQFDKAVATQQEAIALVQNDQKRKEYTSRLELYQANKPFRVEGR